ncbi:hypothetical protein JVT61DRAFT_4167 [Boletus reticuloceps]|uniref:Uncharacterized protein n=1 Tax=Boletus reticuloceps TaxID=495285 RepID=A0A8I2YMX5_9AGAM|nr:hypothetical protein JVT61DRAFT_4167 [Boletus reticuloceps]
MQFPFTFTLNIPGLHNPFLAKLGPVLAHSRFDGTTEIASVPPSRFPPVNSLSPPVSLARKRGWIPCEPEPSHAATSATSTTGYLDTPAKYRDMPFREPEQEIEEMIAELPPAKRRRTLAGSIVSTALSAALIGTAVGLTVYRLWRDRGTQPGPLPPPPPYQRGDWVSDVSDPVGSWFISVVIDFISRCMHPKQIETTTSPKTRKPRPTPSSVRRSAGRHHRKPRARLQTVTPPRSVSPAYTSPRSELDYVHIHHHADDVEPEVEPDVDQMDWIGDRLTRLIQEGQKALGREIVVMSDAKEDEVDDGSDAWEEEQDSQPVPSVAGPSISRRGSVRSLRRTHKPRDIPLPPSYTPCPTSPPSSASPRKRRFESDSVHLSPGRSTAVSSTSRLSARGTSVESDAFAPIVSSFKEDESVWQSPELRESMERARARHLQRRVQ